MSNSPRSVRQMRQAVVQGAQQNSSIALSAEDQERIDDANDAIRAMNTALRSVYEDLKGSLQTNDSTGLIFFYQTGCTMLDVKEDRKGTTYGTGAYTRLCKALSLNKNIADKACIFAKQYDRTEVQGLAALRNEVTGKGLTSEHMRYLLVDYLSDAVDPEVKLQELKERRLGYIRRCIAGSWTAKQLKEVIMRENGREPAAGRNRILLGKDATLQKIIRFHTDGVNNMTKSWLNNEKNVLTLLTENLDDVTPDTLMLLDEALHELRAYKTLLDALVSQWENNNPHQLYVDHLGGQLRSVEDANLVETARAAEAAIELDLPDI